MASALATSAAAAPDNAYRVTNLVSDQPGQAPHVDPNLVNAWGLVAGPATPFWVADNATSVSTLYDGSGNPIPLVVSVDGNRVHFVAPDGTFDGEASGDSISGSVSGSASGSFSLRKTEPDWNPYPNGP